MKEKLNSLLELSYSPYSNFRVSSIVVMKDGSEFTGVNLENASLGASICAERVAILKAVSSGYRKGDFASIYVMGDSEDITASCFLCRQMMIEFFAEDAEVIFMNNQGEEVRYLIKDICPIPFDNKF